MLKWVFWCWRQSVSSSGADPSTGWAGSGHSTSLPTSCTLCPGHDSSPGLPAGLSPEHQRQQELDQALLLGFPSPRCMPLTQRSSAKLLFPENFCSFHSAIPGHLQKPTAAEVRGQQSENRPVCGPREEAAGEYGLRNDRAKALDQAIGKRERSGFGVPRLLGEAKWKP